MTRCQKSPASSGKHLTNSRIVASNLRLLQLGDLLAARFEELKVPYALLKGAAFVDTIYSDISTRAMTDVDILVPFSFQARAHEICIENGLSFIPPPTNKKAGWKEHYNWQYTSSDGALVEIHFALSPKGMFKIDYSALLSRCINYETAARNVTTLSPEDTLLALAIHEAKHAYLLSPHSSQDIKRAVEHWPPNWSVVVKRAGSWGCTSALYLAFSRALSQGAAIPQNVIEQLRPGNTKRAALWMLFGLASNAKPRIPSLPTWFKFAATLGVVDGFKQRKDFLAVYTKRRLTDASAALEKKRN